MATADIIKTDDDCNWEYNSGDEQKDWCYGHRIYRNEHDRVVNVFKAQADQIAGCVEGLIDEMQERGFDFDRITIGVSSNVYMKGEIEVLGWKNDKYFEVGCFIQPDGRYEYDGV